jgi:thiol:disulfide interchange protein DsbD
MERNTFPDGSVQTLLEQILPLRADVTSNDQIDQALMKQFDIIGPPAILFFDRRGEEMRPYRLVGYFTPDKFSAHLQKVLDAP